MKVLKKFWVLIFFFFSFITLTLASNELKFDWKNDGISAEWNESLVEISDGFLLGDIMKIF